MKVQFRSLFSVEVTHSFYQGRCRDFRFLVPPETRRRLEGGRLLAREVDGVLRVLFEADEAGDPLVSLSGARLRFGLRLLNPYFGNFTQTPVDFPGRMLYYANAPDPAVLAAQPSPAWVGELFAHAPTDAARPVTVTLKDAGGDALETGVLEDPRSTISFDLRGRPSGPLSLEEVFPTETHTVPCFFDPELQRLDVAGVVEVEIDDAFPAAPPELQIPFLAREEVLRYYLVARNYSNSDVNQLRVSDEGSGEDQRPEIGFQKVLPAAFTAAEIPPALIAGPGERVVLFRSQAPVARQARGRRRIQLSKHNDLLIANLPQPGADRARADLIVHVSKP